ncbi:MAG: sporulation integral membrane protein YtvI [Bacillota bacterium]|jgi:sporulation integral membrane protein YtvI
MLKNMDQESLIKLLLKVLIILLIIVLIIISYNYLLPVLEKILTFLLIIFTPFIIAWIISIITRPVVEYLTYRLHMPKAASVLLMMAVLVFLLFWVCYIVITRIVFEISNISDNLLILQDGIERLSLLINDISLKLHASPHGFIDIEKIFSVGGKFVNQMLEGFFISLLGFLQNTPTIFLFILIVFVATFFFSRDEDLLRKLLFKITPAAKKNQVSLAYDSLEKIIGGYARSQIILSTISTCICIVFYYILQVEGALAIGLLTGMLDALPLLGAGFLIIPWIIYCFIIGNTWLGFGLIIFYIILVAVRNILEPKLVGDRIGLHPLATLAAIFVGLQIFGIMGLIFGPILLAIVVAFYRLNKGPINIKS